MEVRGVRSTAYLRCAACFGFKPLSVITEDEREIASEGGMRHVAPEGELLYSVGASVDKNQIPNMPAMASDVQRPQLTTTPCLLRLPQSAHSPCERHVPLVGTVSPRARSRAYSESGRTMAGPVEPSTSAR